MKNKKNAKNVNFEIHASNKYYRLGCKRNTYSH